MFGSKFKSRVAAGVLGVAMVSGLGSTSSAFAASNNSHRSTKTTQSVGTASVLGGDTVSPDFLGDWAKKAAEVAGSAFVGGFTAKAGAASWDFVTTLGSSSSSDSSSSSSSSSGSAQINRNTTADSMDMPFDVATN